MPVTVSCRTTAGRPWVGYLRRRGAEVLAALDLAGDELSLSLVDDGEMRALNGAYRGRDRATDVLAFALTESVAPEVPIAVASARRSARGDRVSRVLGDVVISIDTAAAQARSSRRPLATRLDALLVHGVLHLIGYDHERSLAEERRMRAKERAVATAMRKLNATANPKAIASTVRGHGEAVRHAKRRVGMHA